MPFVSGIKRIVIIINKIFNAAYNQKVPAAPNVLTKVKNVAPKIVLLIQQVAVEQAMPNSLLLRAVFLHRVSSIQERRSWHNL